MHDLEIKFDPHGKNGTGYLTFIQDGEPIEFGTVNLANAKARAGFASRVAKKCPGQDPDALEAELMKIGAAQAAAKPEPTGDEPPDDDPGVLLSGTPEIVKAAARAMLENPALADAVSRDVALLVAGEREMSLTIYLVGTSRLLAKPLACIVQGQSSTGKSHVIKQVGTMFPAECVITATQMTPQALYHMEPGALEHRFVIAGERSRIQNDDKAEGTRALREMISEGRLTKLMPVKVDGEIKTVPIYQEGPIAFIESTTLSNVFNEDANRCIMIMTDERPEQTQRILRKVGDECEGKALPGVADDVREKHHAMQRMLKPHIVVIPFAGKLVSMLSFERVEARRAGPQLMSMIQASALLHQYQRKIDGHGRLLAEFSDYILAYHLLAGPLNRALGGRLSDPATRFHGRLAGYVTGQFTSREIAGHERGTASKRAVYGWLSELHEAGLIDLIEAGRGPRPSTWKMGTMGIHDVKGNTLPTPKELGETL